MNRQLYLHLFILDELRRYEKLHSLLQAYLLDAPSGSLLNRNGHIYRAFREGGRQHQMPAGKDAKMIQKIKLKFFIKKALPVLERKINNCKQFIEAECIYEPMMIVEELKSVYQSFDYADIFLEGDYSLENWKSEKYVRNAAPFEKEHFTGGKVQVRSKAEAMIGTQAEARGMHFRCEPEKWIDNKRAYPDFEFFLPKSRKRVYLEHFGQMDDLKYLKRAMFKLMNYHKAGLFLGINFFFTWETEEKPLTYQEINEVLDIIEALDE